MGRKLTNDQKTTHFLDLGEAFLVWSIALATLHLTFVKKRQITRALDKTEKICLNISLRNKILQEIKNKRLIFDVTACFLLVTNITICCKVLSIETVLRILGSFFATVIILGIFLEIRLTALKNQLIFKYLNQIIEVSFKCNILIC
jgi:hypothetical protein